MIVLAILASSLVALKLHADLSITNLKTIHPEFIREYTPQRILHHVDRSHSRGRRKNSLSVDSF
jgi:hypothetical protein